jgi:hypothetical protein
MFLRNLFGTPSEIDAIRVGNLEIQMRYGNGLDQSPEISG